MLFLLISEASKEASLSFILRFGQTWIKLFDRTSSYFDLQVTIRWALARIGLTRRYRPTWHSYSPSSVRDASVIFRLKIPAFWSPINFNLGWPTISPSVTSIRDRYTLSYITVRSQATINWWKLLDNWLTFSASWLRSVVIHDRADTRLIHRL